jgi:hypothetical protein
MHAASQCFLSLLTSQTHLSREICEAKDKSSIVKLLA